MMCLTVLGGYSPILKGLLLEVIHSAAEHAGIPCELRILIQHFAGTLGMAHAAEDAAVGAGDAFDGLHAAVGAEQDVHAGLAAEIHILGGDLAVGGELGNHLFACNEAAFTVADGAGEHIAHA